MNPLGFAITLLLSAVVLSLPRRWATLGMMAGVLYLTQDQQVLVGGFNFFAMRFLELAGFVRVMARREFSFSRLNNIDRTFLLLYSFLAIVYTLRATEGQVFIIGMAVDACLCYFTFRGLVRDIEDLRWFLRFFVILLIPYATIVMIESLYHYNLFSLLGGGNVGGWERGDRFRSVGSFRNPTLLGTLGVVFLPLYIGLVCIRADRLLALGGIGACGAIVWASNSGGPLSAAAMALVGWMFWKKRTQMRKVRRWLVVGLVVVAIVMKAPIWYLLDRISQVTGGDGYNRAYLIDVSFQHLGEWWFAGMPIKQTRDWFPYFHNITGGADITNQFISFGLIAGLGAIVLVIVLLKRTFSSLGGALAAVRANLENPPGTELLLWGLGVTVATHIASWLGITYFDQTYVIWFMQLAVISSLSSELSGVSFSGGTEVAGAGLENERLRPDLNHSPEFS